MNTLKLGLLVCGLFIAADTANVHSMPTDAVPVVDNSGVSWGYIPSITNVETLMDSGKWNPVFSPDGEWIAFLGPQRRNIYLVPSSGGTPVQIYKLPLESYYRTFGMTEIHFTPDSREITYVRQIYDPSKGSYFADTGSNTVSPRNLFYSIESVNLATKKSRVIINGGNFCNWSYDGRYLCFINIDYRVHTDPAHAEHNCAPAIYDTQTGKTQFLTNENWDLKAFNSSGISGPYLYTAFSPDGSHIITSRWISGTRQLVKIPFNGGDPQQITFFDNKVFIQEWGTSAYWPRYSPDGKWLIFNVGNTMVIMDVATGKIYDFFSRKPFETCNQPVDTPLFQIEAAWMANWSADGKKLVYSFFVTGDKLRNIVSSDSTVSAASTYTVIYDFEDYELDGFGKPTLVEETTPANFAINGNFPNPFNPATTISFSLPFSGEANLAVYNVTGQKIRELVSGFLTAGRHSVVWDGRDQNGSSVSSGVYISRLMMRDKVTTGRMLLVK